jgi:hypothetical protein
LNDVDVRAIRAGAVALQPTPGYRLGFVSLAAAVIGFTAGLIAFLLYNLMASSPTWRSITNGLFISEARKGITSVPG